MVESSSEEGNSSRGVDLESRLDLEREGTSAAHVLSTVERGGVRRAVDRHVDTAAELIAGEVESGLAGHSEVVREVGP